MRSTQTLWLLPPRPPGSHFLSLYLQTHVSLWRPLVSDDDPPPSSRRRCHSRERLQQVFVTALTAQTAPLLNLLDWFSQNHLAERKAWKEKVRYRIRRLSDDWVNCRKPLSQWEAA